MYESCMENSEIKVRDIIKFMSFSSINPTVKSVDNSPSTSPVLTPRQVNAVTPVLATNDANLPVALQEPSLRPFWRVW